MIGQFKNIYIYCLAGVKSGGPELLHQLSYQLKNFGFDCSMVYYGKKDEIESTNPEFLKYNPVEIMESEVIDKETSLVIVPETSIFHLNKFKKVKKAIWWLSVDNYTQWATPKGRYKAFGALKVFTHPFLMINAYKTVKSADYHLCQSYYSKIYVEQKQKINSDRVFMLSDYISDNYLKDVNNQHKEDIVAFFPRKGYAITKKLMEQGKDITWVPIQNMTSEQVQSLLLRCKVYIDFGHFPGKDRVPREAAMCKCCVITGKYGASYYSEDLPILEKYKFERPVDDADKILKLIHECLKNYEINSKDFDSYRKVIRREKDVFVNQVKELFIE